MSLPYIELVPKSIREAFEEQVTLSALKLRIDPVWLMCVMYKESRVSASIVNKSTGAVGLIQFMPSTLIDLKKKVSTPFKSDGSDASYITQLQYVEAYLNTYVGKMKSYIDVYFAVFYPAAIGKSDNDIIGITRSEAYAKLLAKQNSGLDGNKDGYVTVAEAKTWFQLGFTDTVKKYLVKVLPYKYILIPLFFFAVIYALYKAFFSK